MAGRAPSFFPSLSLFQKKKDFDNWTSLRLMENENAEDVVGRRKSKKLIKPFIHSALIEASIGRIAFLPGTIGVAIFRRTQTNARFESRLHLLLQAKKA